MQECVRDLTPHDGPKQREDEKHIIYLSARKYISYLNRYDHCPRERGEGESFAGWGNFALHHATGSLKSDRTEFGANLLWTILECKAVFICNALEVLSGELTPVTKADRGCLRSRASVTSVACLSLDP